MNFAGFLKRRRKIREISTVSEHYRVLGGMAALGVSLRQFQLLENGKQVPSHQILNFFFNKTPPSDRKLLIESYFLTALESVDENERLKEYLSQYLSPMIPYSKSILEESKNKTIMNEQQMNFLYKNPTALKIYKLLIWKEEIPRSEIDAPLKLLNDLKKLKLIKLGKDKVRYATQNYLLPNPDNSNPKLRRSQTKYILNQINEFVSEEGSEDQYIAYTTSVIPKSSVENIFKQQKAFQRWILSQAIQAKPGPDDYPLLFISFSKFLKEKDLSN